jgi:hypothetical protein
VPIRIEVAQVVSPGFLASVRYKTSAGFNIGALGVVLILVALYATWW